MASRHLLGTSGSWIGPARMVFGPSRRLSVRVAHLSCMDTEQLHRDNIDTLEVVLTLGEPAGVTAQTLYDLRSQGRGPCGFRVGRQLRFRLGEVEAWLRRLEDDDAGRHPAGGSR
jgi:predicted DNA-binding transcriptional regulator AlpA